MKKLCLLLSCALMLSACAAVPTFEKLSDEYVPADPVREPRQVYLELPEGAASPAMGSTEGERLYLCDGYEVTVETCVSGNIASTVRSVTGCAMESLTVLERQENGISRYDMAWTAPGEAEDQVCRCAILDDGCYHYAVCVAMDASRAKSCAAAADTVMSTIGLSG